MKSFPRDVFSLRVLVPGALIAAALALLAMQAVRGGHTEVSAGPSPVPAQAPAGKISDWAVPEPSALPHDPAVAPDGSIWLTLMNADKLARFDPRTHEWKLFPVPTKNAGPHGLTADHQGNIWFTENRAGKIGRLDPRSGKIVEFKTATVTDPHTPIFTPDGYLWFTAEESNAVSRLDTRTGEVQVHTVPTAHALPYGIVIGADGALWFCEFGVNKLGRIDPATGEISEHVVPDAQARPRRLVALGDAIYFSDFHGGRLGRYDLRDSKFRLWPSPGGADSAPYGIATDTAGNIWYEEFRANNLVRFDPRTGKFTGFPMPSAHSGVRNMARDAQGRIWMALSGADKVGVVQ
jgi:virginiamycin B lyase